MKTTINQRGEYGRGCAPNILCIISRHYLWLLCSLCTHGSPTRLCRDPDNQITPEHASPLVPTPSKISITASVFRSFLQLSQVCHRDKVSGVYGAFFFFFLYFILKIEEVAAINLFEERTKYSFIFTNAKVYC